ncbi:MAG: 50S ribosomal protein L1 [Candidatus Bathyarchaeia archaeon]
MPIDGSKLVQTVEKAASSSEKNFRQSMDLIVNLRDVDLKKPGTKLNEPVELPHNIPKTVKVCVIGSGQMVLDAKKAGADMTLTREELEGLAKDKKAARKLAKEIDSFIAEAPFMPTVGKTVGSFLGPRGKMPTPVPPNSPLQSVIEKHRRTIKVRVGGQPVIQCRVGTGDMPPQHIAENIQAVLRLLEQKLERGERNIGNIYVKSTMGAPVRVESGE